MHVLQPKHTKLSEKEVEKLLNKYNIALTQLPKISIKDPALEGKFSKGDVVKVERKYEDKLDVCYRVVI